MAEVLASLWRADLALSSCFAGATTASPAVFGRWGMEARCGSNEGRIDEMQYGEKRFCMSRCCFATLYRFKYTRAAVEDGRFALITYGEKGSFGVRASGDVALLVASFFSIRDGSGAAASQVGGVVWRGGAGEPFGWSLSLRFAAVELRREAAFLLDAAVHSST